MKDVTILGAGIAGLACALWCRRLGLTVDVFDVASDTGGQLHLITYDIPDLPGWSGTGSELAAYCTDQVVRAGADIHVGRYVDRIDVAEKAIHTGGVVQRSNYLVLAMGSQPRKLHVPGEEGMLQRGEVYRGSQHAELLRGKTALVVGGGDRAVENALLLASADVHVVLAFRKPQLRAQHRLVQAVLQHPNIQLAPNTTVESIEGEHQVEGAVLNNAGQSEYLACQAILIYIGRAPVTHLVQHDVELHEEQGIDVQYTGATNIPDVYAVGDVCLYSSFSSIASCLGQGMVVAKTIATNIL